MTYECHSAYTDTNDYVTYYCILDTGHAGPHEDDRGPGMRWYA